MTYDEMATAMDWPAGKLRAGMRRVIACAPNQVGYGIWQHFKGGFYTIITMAKDAETGQMVCVYGSLDPGQTQWKWMRTISNFNEHIAREDYAGPRFRYFGALILEGAEANGQQPVGT